MNKIEAALDIEAPMSAQNCRRNTEGNGRTSNRLEEILRNMRRIRCYFKQEVGGRCFVCADRIMGAAEAGRCAPTSDFP